MVNREAASRNTLTVERGGTIEQRDKELDVEPGTRRFARPHHLDGQIRAMFTDKVAPPRLLPVLLGWAFRDHSVVERVSLDEAPNVRLDALVVP